jgi:hypothetical protein
MFGPICRIEAMHVVLGALAQIRAKEGLEKWLVLICAESEQGSKQPLGPGILFVPGGSFEFLGTKKKIKMAMTKIMPSMAGLNSRNAIVFSFQYGIDSSKRQRFGRKEILERFATPRSARV